MSIVRLVFLAHRYLGIALGLLMTVWCLSGIVMMYVPYPSLAEADRLRALDPIDAAACCTIGGPAGDAKVAAFQIEMFAGHPIIRLVSPGGRQGLYDLFGGGAAASPGREEALAVARNYARAHGLAGEPEFLREVEWDQWSTGRFGDDRPLLLFALNDPAGTELYVSSTSGRTVQVTNRSIRFWNWLGSVPHWLYFARLRENAPLWSEIVIWTSLFGCVLTVLGIYIGVSQVRRRKSDGRLASPYRGLWYWHHVPGLVFGVFTLTWVFSGLLSMNPWGYLGGTSPQPALERLQGPPQDWETLRAALPALLAGLPEGTVHVQSAPFDGQLFVVATAPDGNRQRLNGAGAPAVLNEVDYALAAARISEGAQAVSWELTGAEDAYFYGLSNEPPPLPVLRVITKGEGGARYYLDPLSARLIYYADADGRMSRWLFSGLHSLDFTSLLRLRPVWDVVMIALLLGATLVCATGTYIGARRLVGRPQRGGLLGAPQLPNTRANMRSTSLK